MKNLVLFAALCAAAAPACANQGCIEISTITVTSTVCEQFDCIQRSDGACIMWNCTRTHSSKYVDPSGSGCTRLANCGKNAVLVQGAPVEGDNDSSEQCDWYPCVEASQNTHACTSSMCVSKRVFNTERTVYPDAVCVPFNAVQPPQPEAAKPAKDLKNIKPIKPEKKPQVIPRLK